MIDIVGRYNLFAYAIGVLVFLALGAILRRSIAITIASTPNAFDSDRARSRSLAIAGKLSELRWTWPAITQLTVAKGLLCLWIGSQSAVAIPERAFASDEERKSAIAFIESGIAAAKPTDCPPSWFAVTTCFSAPGTPLSRPPRMPTTWISVNPTDQAFCPAPDLPASRR